MLVAFTLNTREVSVDADEDMPLLWAVRDLFALTGTKYGCGRGFCGACTVHLDGIAVRSCQIPLSAAAGRIHYDDRRFIDGRLAPRAARVARAASAAVRLLPAGPDHDGRSALIVTTPARRPRTSTSRCAATCAAAARIRAFAGRSQEPQRANGLISRLSRRQLLVGLTGVTAIAGGTGLWLVVERVRSWRFRNAVDRGSCVRAERLPCDRAGGDVVIWVAQSEMGQGIETALPMIVAEELDADWSRVRVERAVLDAPLRLWLEATAASASVRADWTELRRAGATARQMLMARRGRPPGPYRRTSSRRSKAPSPTCARIGGSATANWQTQPRSERPPLRPRLKDPREFRLIGRTVPRRDIPAKVSGTAVFGLDVRLPGMLYAAIARNPAFGGQPIEIDDSAARLRAGVVDVVAVPTGVAVVGVHSYAALRGRDALRVEWPTPAHAGFQRVALGCVTRCRDCGQRDSGARRRRRCGRPQRSTRHHGCLRGAVFGACATRADELRGERQRRSLRDLGANANR